MSLYIRKLGLNNAERRYRNKHDVLIGVLILTSAHKYFPHVGILRGFSNLSAD